MTSAPSSTTSHPDPPLIEVFTARSGARSLRVNGRALHSPYDPLREAERFISENLGSEAPAVVVLLGEALGHVGAAVRAAFQGVRLITVVYSEEIFRASGAPAASTWHPGSGRSVGAFLRAELGELDIEGLRVLEWPASAQAFPEVSRAAGDAMRRVAQERNGSFATTCAAAQRWLRNSIANFLGIDTALPSLPGGPRRPIIVAAPGPSLEQAAPFIARNRDHAELWALPSSCLFLTDAGLRPDLVVLTDPGWYAMHHLQCARTSAPVAMPLSAARGAWGLGGADGRPAVFLMSQPVFYERALLEAAGLRSPEIAPHGTVAATAIELARASTRAPVVVAGLDMCMKDVVSHARPNAFDILLQLASGRSTPHTSLWFQRAAAQQAGRLPGAQGARVSPSLRTYAGWFDDADGAAGIYRLFPSPVALAGMRDLDGAGLSALLRTAGGTSNMAGPRAAAPAARLPSLDNRKRILRKLLGGWESLLQGASPDIAWDRGSGEPGPDPTALSIAYMIEPRLLMEARRLRRLGRLEDAREASRNMLARAGGILRALAERACNGP